MKKITLMIIFLITIVLISCDSDKIEKLEYSGNIECNNLIISSQSMGKIEALFLDEGDIVKKGDTLAIIEHEKLDLQIVQAEAAKNAILAQIKMLKVGARKEDKNLADESLKQAEANYEVAKANKNRMNSLFESKSITKKQFDDANLAFDIANSMYNSAKQNVTKSKSSRPEQIEQLNANLEQANASISLLKKSRNDCYITANISGQIVNRFIEKGEIVTYMTSLFNIIDLTKAELTIYVPETELAFIQLGQSVNINIDAFDDKSFPGKIAFISPEAEFTPKSIQTKDERTKLVFAVKIKMDNPDKILKSGMPADAVINLAD
ncbi:MAG: efflux RND transporter periplasmic adaptor subunit [Bacteroidetes bacterium]|nr:efflux RND transporter periplasmic adaptor subunit [Bacteroidota bacterium]MBU1113824.1 efflux RND transporter periplasmic adaptor subunit [Bacteroidota bacterium]MBU1799590.1 efflux RND transporter periplasmic adaptor subunit [Bacteroidota bacterium]